MRGEETTKLDREILADIAGKTNQLGLRFSPDLSKGRMASPKVMNFWKSSKRGGSFPIQKFMLQIFAIINAYSVMYSGKKAQHHFPKMREGGIKGRLELLRTFIRFGGAGHP